MSPERKPLVPAESLGPASAPSRRGPSSQTQARGRATGCQAEAPGPQPPRRPEPEAEPRAAGRKPPAPLSVVGSFGHPQRALLPRGSTFSIMLVADGGTRLLWPFCGISHKH